MGKEFVISDLHFNHENILEYERNEFLTIKEHDEFIVTRWNKTVKNDDTVYFLGDLTMHIDKEYIISLIARLNGYKIMIKGNHDLKSKNYYKVLGFNEVYDSPISLEDGKIVLSHEPIKEAWDSEYIINVHGHLHNNEVINNKNYICVSAKTVNYRPQNLGKIKEWARKNLKKRFVSEAFARYRNDKTSKDEFYKNNYNILEDK